MKIIVLSLVLTTATFISMSCDGENDPVASESNASPSQPEIDIASGAPGNDVTVGTNSVLLKWTCSDPDGDALVYDVYFGTESDPELCSESQARQSYDSGELQSYARYYWRVVAKDCQGHSTGSPVWSFATSAVEAENPVVRFTVPMDKARDVGSDLAGIIVDFSTSMNGSSLVVEFQANGSLIALANSDWNDDSTQVTFGLYRSLEPAEEHAFTIVRGQSIAGKDLSPLPYTFKFSTEELNSLELVYCSLEDRGEPFHEIPVDSPIILIFNEPVLVGHQDNLIEIRDVTDAESRLVEIHASIQDSTVLVSSAYPLEAARVYEICYQLAGATSQTWQDSCLQFFTTVIDIDDWCRIDSLYLDMGDNWRADWNTKQLSFKWATVECATGYKLYAKDNRLNLDPILVADVPAPEFSLWATATVSLPEQFDSRYYDNIQTPFSAETVIEFGVRAYNQAGMGPFVGWVSVADITPPGGGDTNDGGNSDIVVYQSWGSGDNSSGVVEDTVWISLLQQVEYCDTTGPRAWFIEAGGDPGYVLPDSSFFWVWRDDIRMNDYSDQDATGAGIVVPANTDASGDSLYLEFSDNSGNDTTVAVFIAP